MKRKTMAMLLAVMMIIMVLAACNNNANNSTDTTTTDSGTTTTTDSGTTTTTDSGTTTTTETPADTGPAYSEIVVEVFDRGNVGGTDPTNNYYTNWIKEKCLQDLNLGVTFFAVSRWEEEPQLNNLMAAQTAPDLSFTYSVGMITNFSNQGGLTDLLPYMDTLAPDLRAFLGDELFYRDKSKETGKVYSIPSRRMNDAKFGTFIRKDWLDTLGMALPTTTDEFYNALKAFKEKDPGGIGANKVIGLALTPDVAWRAGPLLESFIDPNLTRKDRYTYSVNNSEIIMPGYKEGVRLLNKMYNEGLIDPEFTLYKSDDESDNAIKRGEVGALMHNWDQPYRETPGLVKDLQTNVEGANFVPIDPFKNSAGVTWKSLYDPAGLRMVVPVFSKNPEGVIRYLNWLAIFENRNYLQIGDLGYTHVIYDGIPKVLTTTGERIMNSGNNIDLTPIINGMDYGSPELNGRAIGFAYSIGNDQIESAFAMSKANGYIYPVMGGVEITSEGPVAVDLKEKEKTLFTQAITAKEADFDKVWDDGINNWMASGGNEIKAEREAKYFE